MKNLSANKNNNECTAKVAKNSGKFYKGMKKPENSGRKKGTPNKKTQDLCELMGDYSPLVALLNIAQDTKTPLDIKVKVNLDLMGYIYPKRKSIGCQDMINVQVVNAQSSNKIEEYLKLGK